MATKIHDADSLVLAITVTDESTSLPKDISSATITANAARWNGDASINTVAATIAVTDGPNGEFTASFDAGDLAAGEWVFQSKCVIGSETQIVYEGKILVEPAFV